MLVFSRAFLKSSSGAFAKSQPSYLVRGTFIALLAEFQAFDENSRTFR